MLICIDELAVSKNKKALTGRAFFIPNHLPPKHPLLYYGLRDFFRVKKVSVNTVDVPTNCGLQILDFRFVNYC